MTIKAFWGEMSRTQQVVGIAIAAVLWLNMTFQTKEASAQSHARAEKTHEQLEAKIVSAESRMNSRIESLERTLGDVAKDTNYIRGRLEPRGK